MLIAVDIGNTNIVLGFIEDEQVAATYRITTKSNHTSDEFGIMMLQFLQLKGFAPRDVHDVIITSVVPKVMHSFTAAIVKFLGITPMVVGQGIRTGQGIHYKPSGNDDAFYADGSGFDSGRVAGTPGNPRARAGAGGTRTSAHTVRMNAGDGVGSAGGQQPGRTIAMPPAGGRGGAPSRRWCASWSRLLCRHT